MPYYLTRSDNSDVGALWSEKPHKILLENGDCDFRLTETDDEDDNYILLTSAECIELCSRMVQRGEMLEV